MVLFPILIRLRAANPNFVSHSSSSVACFFASSSFLFESSYWHLPEGDTPTGETDTNRGENGIDDVR
jgi:hypothetical protein